MFSLRDRLSSLRDHLDASLFYIPTLFAVLGIALGQTAIAVDGVVGDIPDLLTATVDSARAVLSVVASATIAFSGVAFSVSLLLFSLSSSQYSPRIVHGLFRDPYNKRIMGIVLGTFSYCLIVLRSVRGPLEEGELAQVPSISIIMAVLLGVITLLAIVAFIDHAAHTMDVSAILHRSCQESLEQIQTQWSQVSDGRLTPEVPPSESATGALRVDFDQYGWVQSVDREGLLDVVEAGTTIRLDTVAGRYAIRRALACEIFPVPSDPDRVRRQVLAAIQISDTRTMRDDASYGVRQLADVALRALSPGINDPTTAQDALFHQATVVGELLTREPPARVVRGKEGRRLLMPQQVDHDEIVGVAFNEVRLAAAGMPTVLIYLLEILHSLAGTLDATADDPRRQSLQTQAQLIVDGLAGSNLLEFDRDRVRTAYQQRFAPDTTTSS